MWITNYERSLLTLKTNLFMSSENKIFQNALGSSLGKAFIFEEYVQLITTLLAQKKVTSGEATEDMLAYTKLNLARMKRVIKTTSLLPELEDILIKNKPFYFAVISEGWCGDAAQIVPILEKINQFKNLKPMKIVLRDENLPLMDLFLTNGVSRSIPIVLCLDENDNLLWHWGPRPRGAQEILDEMKMKNISMELQKERLHKWYSDDKTIQTQLAILEKIIASN
jgi:hypothetical protein